MDIDRKPPTPKPASQTPKPPAETPLTTSSPKPSPHSLNSQVQRWSAQTDEDWENGALTRIFLCTLNEGSVPEGYKYLGGVVEELQSENLPLKITSSTMGQVLYARLSLPENADSNAVPLFDYLVGAWGRTRKQQSILNDMVERAKGDEKVQAIAARRRETLEAARGLLLNYSGLVINPEMADSFPQVQSVAEQGFAYLAPRLLLPNADDFLPQAFLEEFVTHYEKEGLNEIVGPLVNGLVANMRSQNITKDYQTPIRAMLTITSLKPVAAVLPSLRNWNPPNIPAKTIEVLTLLGPFFARPTVFPDADPAIGDTYFASSNPMAFGEGAGHEGLGARNPGDVKSAWGSLRGITETIQNNLKNIVEAIIRASPESREGVIQYISGVVKANKARGRMHVEMSEVSSDGFMFNLLRVCLKLCDPIMNSNMSRIHLVDPDYLAYSDRLDVTEETKINSDKETYEAYLKEWKSANPNPSPPNFVSDVFFLTLAMHHYGLLSTIRHYTDLIKQQEELLKAVKRMRAERDSGRWAGPAGSMQEMIFKRFQAQLDKMVADRLAMEAALMDPAVVEHSMRFYGLVMMFLVRCASLGQEAVKYPPPGGKAVPDAVQWGRVARGDTTGINLVPLPQDAPATFSNLPEWIVDDICEFYLFICRYQPTLFENQPRDEILTFSMVFLQNPQYVKNPYLKSRLVEILYFFTLPLYRTRNGESTGPKLDLVFFTHPLAKQYLVSSLMRMYIDVEHTGMSSQFYDKFNIRYNISQILKTIWDDAGHREQVVVQSRNRDFFVQFVNMLMHDTTYLLGEALSKLKEIQTIQNELETPAAETQEAQRQRQEREGTLAQMERQAQSCMYLGNETVHMFQYMTANKEIVEPFLAPEIVSLLAAMLDYNLAALVGPKCTELKVKNPEKYRFDPKKLLNELMEIFAHLGDRTEFISAVAKDGRSYSKDHFNRAAGILMKNRLKSQSELDPIFDFVARVEEAIRSEAAEEEELGEVPDEFLDPLMATLMEDPVILPTSGQTVDRSTIKTYLLSGAQDPFNRQPLSIDMVIPNEELKGQIDEWRRGQRKGGSGDGPVPMET
ncbi:hypothetical protein HDV00_005788 [Rhizophlyctis rosea]|nr:hypothetical protein HDV00_005788 [Rhizophlyctis rosea]